MISTRFVVLISTVYLAAIPLHAEMIFQPKKSKHAREWRQAGSDLLESLARIFDGLAAVEREDLSAGRSHFHSAMERLNKATRGYASVARLVTRDQKMSIESLAPEEGKEIRKAFSDYHVAPPRDEREAAETAEKELMRLGHSLRKFDEQIGEADIRAVQELLAAITRVERVGTNTALLIELSAAR